jgi:CHASE2 domain-containing sensor protein
MQFGKTVIPQLLGNGSPYQDTGNKLEGYQTLLNYRAYKGDPNNFAPTVRLEDVLKGKVSAEEIQDRIVIIGYTDMADRNAGLWHTSYGDIPGVILQAQMTSQIISAVLNQRSLMGWLPIWGEILWIFGWSTVGGLVVWRFSRAYRLTVVSVVVTLFGLYGMCYFILVSQSVWVPLMPPGIAVVVTGGGVVYLSYRLRQT